MSRPTTPLPQPQLQLTSSTPPAPQPSPLRSTTAPLKKPHHHHHPRIPHRHHHHREKSVPQSAILPSSTSSPFDSLLNPLTKATSRTEGAPDLSSLIKDEREARAKREAKERDGENEKEDMAKQDKEVVKKGWELVAKRRGQRRVGEEALSTSLTSLSTLSTSTTRRLDYTYYSLLSHISSLHGTLSSLAALTTSTSTLLSTFSATSSTLHTDLSAQISIQATHTETQSARLGKLESRIREGGKRVEGLGQRMERVRERVREQERREGEWSGRVRRRVRLCWGVLAVGLAVVILSGLVRHWPRAGHDGFVELVPERAVDVPMEAVDVNGTDNVRIVNVREDRDGDREEHGERVMRMLDEL